jgi:hypothetical protein
MICECNVYLQVTSQKEAWEFHGIPWIFYETFQESKTIPSRRECAYLASLIIVLVLWRTMSHWLTFSTRLDYQDTTNVDQKGIAFTIRSVFIIDPKKTIRLTLSYPASTGRNSAEVLRVIDSLQTGDKHKVTTPINWVPVSFLTLANYGSCNRLSLMGKCLRATMWLCIQASRMNKPKSCSLTSGL